MEIVTPTISFDDARKKLIGLPVRSGGLGHGIGQIDTIYFSRCEPPSVLTAKILSALNGKNLCYRYGKSHTRVPKNPKDRHEILNDATSLAGFLCDHFAFYNTDKDRYEIPSARELSIMLKSTSFISRLQEIKVFTDVAGFSPDFKPLLADYNQVSGIYLTDPEPLEPSFETTALNALLTDIVFKDEASKTNFIASLLMSMFPCSWQGDKPSTLIIASQVGTGKTIAGAIAAIVRSGSIAGAKPMPFAESDAELRKSLISRVMSGQNEIFIDNIKPREGGKQVSSQVLESWITSPEISDRLLGTNKVCSFPNSLHYTLTANATNFSRDLLSRSMIVDLHYDGMADEIRRSTTKPLEQAQELRMRVLAELKGMVVRWIDKGCPRANVTARFRDHAEVIGGILEVNGYKGFLSNSKESEIGLSDELGDLQYLIESQPSFSGAPKDWVAHAHLRKVFKRELGRAKGSGSCKIMSAILTRYIGRKFSVDDDGQQVILRQCDNERKNGKIFYLELVSSDAEVAAEM